MSVILSTKDLSKHYGSFKALDRCSIEVQRGSTFGLLGPNGAGKTTLIRCLLGYLQPTSGTAMIAGYDSPRESLMVRRNVSYLPAESKLFRMARGRDCIEFFTSIHPKGDAGVGKRIAERLELDLARRVGFMSTGMRQKLAICCVMSCAAPVIILDEPTANLDPTVREVVLDLVREANETGSTIVFCSHVLSEIESTCDEVAILRSGSIVHQCDMKSLRQSHRVSGQLRDPNFGIGVNQAVVDFHQAGSQVTFELRGPIERELEWLSNQPLQNVHIDSSGLENLYHQIHRQV